MSSVTEEVGATSIDVTRKTLSAVVKATRS